MLQVNI